MGDEGGYTDTEKRLAKRMRNVLRDEGRSPPSHGALLRLVREHRAKVEATSAEQVALRVLQLSGLLAQ
jgi:hypothetical protein